MPRVHCIFTASSISLSLGWRQPGHHYAIRAGRNLPDKEFRYLRTVIVTAAVYWGFDSKLAPLLLTFQHRAGVRPYTSSCDFAEPCVFDKQSPGPFHCGQHCCWRPFSRSYRSILPNSLAMNLSSTLGFSPRPPVSVCGTGGHACKRLAGFLGSLLRDAISSPGGLEYYRLSAPAAYFTTAGIPTAFNALFRQCAVLSLLRHRIAMRGRCWNINQLSIDLSLRLGLRTRLTLIRLALIRKPWSFGVRVSRPHYRLSLIHISEPTRPY